MNVSKVTAWRKSKKSLLDCKISRFLKFTTSLFWNIDFSPIKKPFSFLTIEGYDTELTNIKISNKNIVPPGGAQAPEGRWRLPFDILLILAWNAESAKNFQIHNFIVYGNKHHSLTGKIGFRVISKLMMHWLASKILISFKKTNFFSFIRRHYGFSKNFKAFSLS